MLPSPEHVLLVTAFAPELAPYGESEGTIPLGHGRARARAVGIGLVDAAWGAALAVAEQAPELVIFSGTCGAYPGCGLAIGDVVSARLVVLVDPAVIEARAHRPSAMPVTADLSPWSASFERAGARPVAVATTQSVTTDDALAAAIAAETRCSVEHLEAFAIARAARALPVAVILGVANLVGKGAQEAWRLHHHDAARKAREVVMRAFQGAGG